jgi:hypothetical protein
MCAASAAITSIWDISALDIFAYIYLLWYSSSLYQLRPSKVLEFQPFIMIRIFSAFDWCRLYLSWYWTSSSLTLRYVPPGLRRRSTTNTAPDIYEWHLYMRIRISMIIILSYSLFTFSLRLHYNAILASYLFLIL